MSRTIEALIKHTGGTSEKKSAGATSQTMKAIRIHNYGGPEALQYQDAPRPVPQAGEVLVRVHAAGVNPIDWKIREGHMKDFWPHKFPLILGWDASGMVEEVGPGVSRFKIGDEVYSVTDLTRDGAYAEIAKIIDSGKLAPIIDRILPLSEARRALELSQSGHTHGKIVLRISNGNGTTERKQL
jgi:NADPH:quinone reductase-like Zn-dependent oxidoreductase